LTAGDIDAVRRGARGIDGAYRDLMERLMAVADADYALAQEAIARLPSGFRRAAALVVLARSRVDSDDRTG